ncbi:hypothetical protein Dimus_003869, partial [Dionaea muscipula]
DGMTDEEPTVVILRVLGNEDDFWYLIVECPQVSGEIKRSMLPKCSPLWLFLFVYVVGEAAGLEMGLRGLLEGGPCIAWGWKFHSDGLMLDVRLLMDAASCFHVFSLHVQIYADWAIFGQGRN